MSKISKLGWYWHRLRAMSPAEVALHVRKKMYARADAKGPPDFNGISLTPAECFPKLPPKANAPADLIDALKRDVADILAGRWKAFGHLPLQVDDPPRWQHDYLVGRDMRSSESAFKLENRAKPGGADIKIIWEPSRWNQLVRLAMGAWLLGDERAREKCVQWLHDWVRNNPAYTGLNWTSGLEVGIRLMQFVWIDGFLEAAGVPNKELDELRRQIVPPHLRYAWRFRSFGSSANNHLLGELAGVILALVRYPGSACIAADLPQVQSQFEKEVLLQFAIDGGNNEQALGYHLFSWEFCWQAQEALHCTGLKVSDEVRTRLRKAGEFYNRMKPAGDVWDYGDCDNAFVTPLFAREENASLEWWNWFGGEKNIGQ